MEAFWDVGRDLIRLLGLAGGTIHGESLSRCGFAQDKPPHLLLGANGAQTDWLVQITEELPLSLHDKTRSCSLHSFLILFCFSFQFLLLISRHSCILFLPPAEHLQSCSFFCYFVTRSCSCYNILHFLVQSCFFVIVVIFSFSIPCSIYRLLSFLNLVVSTGLSNA